MAAPSWSQKAIDAFGVLDVFAACSCNQNKQNRSSDCQSSSNKVEGELEICASVTQAELTERFQASRSTVSTDAPLTAMHSSSSGDEHRPEMDSCPNYMKLTSEDLDNLSLTSGWETADLEASKLDLGESLPPCPRTRASARPPLSSDKPRPAMQGPSLEVEGSCIVHEVAGDCKEHLHDSIESIATFSSGVKAESADQKDEQPDTEDVVNESRADTEDVVNESRADTEDVVNESRAGTEDVVNESRADTEDVVNESRAFGEFQVAFRIDSLDAFGEFQSAFRLHDDDDELARQPSREAEDLLNAVFEAAEARVDTCEAIHLRAERADETNGMCREDICTCYFDGPDLPPDITYSAEQITGALAGALDAEYKSVCANLYTGGVPLGNTCVVMSDSREIAECVTPVGDNVLESTASLPNNEAGLIVAVGADAAPADEEFIIGYEDAAADPAGFKVQVAAVPAEEVCTAGYDDCTALESTSHIPMHEANVLGDGGHGVSFSPVLLQNSCIVQDGTTAGVHHSSSGWRNSMLRSFACKCISFCSR